MRGARYGLKNIPDMDGGDADFADSPVDTLSANPALLEKAIFLGG